MKLLGRHIEKDGSGYVQLMPEEPEDLWHAYHMLAVGDILRSTTIRKVKSESNTGSVDSQRVRMTLSVQVVSVEFDVAGAMLRVNGRVVNENEFVRLGAFHTIEMELHRKFSIQKNTWDEIALERVAMACDAAARADVAAVVMQEGLAHVCLVTPHMTILKAKIDMPLPRKRRGAPDQQSKALLRFFGKVMEAIVAHVNFEVVNCVLVASPGFTREQFCSFLFAEATRTDCKVIAENRSKFLQVHSSSGFMHALKEVLEDPAVASLLAETKAAGEVQALKAFHAMLNTDPDRAYYGLQHVTRAAALQAIDTLLVTDELFRSANVDDRRRYVKLVQDVRDNGGSIKIFSSLHVSGEQLALLSGVAAILRYPLPEIEDEFAPDDRDAQAPAHGAAEAAAAATA